MEMIMSILLFLIACTASVETEKEFAAAYAESQCYAYKQCYRMLFEGEYDGMLDCEEKIEGNFLEENAAAFEGCSYSASAAEECIVAINEASCADLWTKEEEIYQSCHSDIWECP